MRNHKQHNSQRIVTALTIVLERQQKLKVYENDFEFAPTFVSVYIIQVVSLNQPLL